MRRVLLLLVFLLMSACAYSPTAALVSMPKTPVSATSATQVTKEGEAVCWNILGIAAYGDCSIETAKKNGGIKEVVSVDQDNFSVLGLFYKTKIIVKGN